MENRNVLSEIDQEITNAEAEIKQPKKVVIGNSDKAQISAFMALAGMGLLGGNEIAGMGGRFSPTRFLKDLRNSDYYAKDKEVQQKALDQAKEIRSKKAIKLLIQQDKRLLGEFLSNYRLGFRKVPQMQVLTPDDVFILLNKQDFMCSEEAEIITLLFPELIF